jgi:DNA-damage-inducible protein D
MPSETTPFETIRRTNPAGNQFWSSRDFAKVLGYADYRNFQSVIESARTACFNSGQRVEDHFVEVTDMVEIGSGAQHPLKTIIMSRHSTLLLRLNDEVAALAAKVDSHLKKMGAAL